MRALSVFASVTLAAISILAACGDDKPAGEGSSTSSSGGNTTSSGTIPIIPDDGGSSSSSSSGQLAEAGDAGGDAAVDLPTEDLCTALEQKGQLIGETPIAGAAPPPLGGTLLGGTYTLSEIRSYEADFGPGDDDEAPPPPIAQFGRSTLRISKNGLRLLDARAATTSLPAPTQSAYTYTVVAADKKLELAPTCSAAGTLSRPYTVEGNLLQIYTTTKNVDVYSRQP